MEKVKLAIVYYSSTGTNYVMAKTAEEYAKAYGAEVRLRRVAETVPEEGYSKNPLWKKTADETKDVPLATGDDLVWADAILFSSPTRFGVLSGQMKNFLDGQGGIWGQGLLKDKIVSHMTSAMNVHGGQEMTSLSLYVVMMHWGAIIVTPGYTDPVLYSTGGNPYGASTRVGPNGEMMDDIDKAIEVQVKRMIDVTAKFKG